MYADLFCLKFSLTSQTSNLPRRTDVRKFTPVSYRSSSLWGPCPALTPLLKLIIPSRELGTADHVQVLDDLLLFVYFGSLWSHYICTKCHNSVRHNQEIEKKVHAKSMTILNFCKTSLKYDLDGCTVRITVKLTLLQTVFRCF